MLARMSRRWIFPIIPQTRAASSYAQRPAASASSFADRMASATRTRAPAPSSSSSSATNSTSTAHSSAAIKKTEEESEINNKSSLDVRTPLAETFPAVSEWHSGYQGIGLRPFPAQVAHVLCEPVDKNDVEIKPDGLLYLPEIKYRRILNRAFGPGGWGLAPQGEPEVSQGILSREWTLICLGRFVSTARGEQEFFKPTGIPTANEGAKSNALMRCCKDLGIASELWDPRFIRQFKAKHCVEVWCQTSDGKKYVCGVCVNMCTNRRLIESGTGAGKMTSLSNTPPKKQA